MTRVSPISAVRDGDATLPEWHWGGHVIKSLSRFSRWQSNRHAPAVPFCNQSWLLLGRFIGATVLNLGLPTCKCAAITATVVLFLPRDAMVAQYMLSSCVCMCVCRTPVLCQNSQTWDHAKKPRDISGTLVLWCQKSWRNSNEITPNGTPNAGGV